MSGPKRTDFEREHDRTQIARLYLTRVPQGEIADRLHLSQPQVSRELAAVRREWQKARIRDFDTDLNRELARIDALEIEYWEAWRESRKPKKVETTQQRQGDEQVTFFVALKTEETAGNPQFLAGVQWCIDRRIKLIGLDAPMKIAPTDPTGEKPYESLTDAERIARLVAILDAARARRDGSPPGDDPPGPLPEVSGDLSG